MKRPITTLFMLMSIDGKITSGFSDVLDADRDWKFVNGVKEGIHQYYDAEQCTDLWSLNSGKVMAKVGMNEKERSSFRTPVSFVIIDNKPHLNEKGIEYLCSWLKQLVIVTTNKEHPAYACKEDNLNIIYQEEFDGKILLNDLTTLYHVDRLTIQSGGTMNGYFLRNKCFDYLDIFIAPILIGGKDTSTLIDGDSITSVEELHLLQGCKLIESLTLKNSFVRLRYEVLK
ncbi:dihydrofolate reductase family protein [Anaerorhabdus sp.]|jgi:2,5-diamino-6-(ribosylamino)-4(3H)-pyrimidinone 5'-phosphate reductase|uniref:dihydrofolate reductase family protein n=1 Tax=Anaerorhabdus sp. TaxID=1872524 RepID=UPI002FC825A5